jgi:hypothetical protein
MSQASQNAILGKPHSQRGSSDRPTKRVAILGTPAGAKPPKPEPGR